MNGVKEHYDQFLGHLYAWMMGDFDSQVDVEKAYFEKVIKNIKPGLKALDLGAGHGIHSFALAKLGFHVEAVDQCAPLLERLKVNKGALNIRPTQKDMRVHRPLAPSDVVSCMGDTLALLESMEELSKFAEHIKNLLKPNGMFITSFRDFSADQKGTSRCVMVRSDDTHILDCTMFFQVSTIEVVDSFHEKTSQGWQLKSSSYRKLRLTAEEVMKVFKSKGLTPSAQETSAGFIRLAFRA